MSTFAVQTSMCSQEIPLHAITIANTMLCRWVESKKMRSYSNSIAKSVNRVNLTSSQLSWFILPLSKQRVTIVHERWKTVCWYKLLHSWEIHGWNSSKNKHAYIWYVIWDNYISFFKSLYLKGPTIRTTKNVIMPTSVFLLCIMLPNITQHSTAWPKR